MSEKTREQLEEDNKELANHLIATIGLLKKFYLEETRIKGMNGNERFEYIDNKLKQHVDAVKNMGTHI